MLLFYLSFKSWLDGFRTMAAQCDVADDVAFTITIGPKLGPSQA